MTPRPPPLLIPTAPRITSDVFAAVLAAAQSPATPDAAALYRIPIAYGIDPAVALAFFGHESTYGTRGVAVETRGWGNVRPAALACVGAASRSTGAIRNFAAYATWADGLHDWCAYMRCRFFDRGLTTVEAIVPIYAPSSDGNRPAAYIATVRASVARWEAQSAAIADPWAGWGDAAPLVREHAIPQRWAREGDLGPALAPEVYRPDGGASIQWFQRGVILWLGGDRTEVVRG